MLYDRAAPLQRALDDGFDGVYLDWIEAFADPAVAKVAREEGVDPAAAMIAFVRELRETAHRRDPVFLVVPQNGAELVAGHPAYLGVIDGLAVEDLSFGGGADTAWDDPASGDQPRPADDQAELASLIGVYRAAGLPVFCVDYALQPAHAARARDEAARVGCVSFVSRTSLDRLPSPAPAARPAGGGRGG